MSAHKAIPLRLMVRRLAPHVASGMIGFNEALDTIMTVVVERARPEHLDRLVEIEHWLCGMLIREAGARPTP